MTSNHYCFGNTQADTKFKIVIPTTHSLDEIQMNQSLIPSILCLGKMYFGKGVFVDVEVVYDNKEGLSTVYNQAILESLDDKNKKDDFIIFTHDDIWLNDVMMFDKIISSSDKLDVIGVCGGKTWSRETTENGKPIIWTVASAKVGGSGFMLHGAPVSWNPTIHDMNYKERSYFSTNYGNSPSRTFTIDGSFMCFGKKAIEELRFDETFKFHYYDMDVSFSAYSKGLRVGTVPILLTHNSLGESVAQPSYMEMQKEFLKKWFNK